MNNIKVGDRVFTGYINLSPDNSKKDIKTVIKIKAVFPNLVVFL